MPSPATKPMVKLTMGFSTSNTAIFEMNAQKGWTPGKAEPGAGGNGALCKPHTSAHFT